MVVTMSTCLKVRGTLTFATSEALEDLDETLHDDEGDEATAEVARLVAEGVHRSGKTLTLDIDGQLTAEANLFFHGWLEDAVELAERGHLDHWSEDHGEARFFRLHAGGREEQVDGPFPPR
jgi:hypothetical protein